MTLDRRTAIALLVAAAFFMENLDATVIITALPAMAADFGTQAANLSVGVSAYLVALTVFIPVSGWATERFGARRIFCAAVVVFTGASLLCAGSQSLTGFTLARILQGIGGAMMVPVGRMVVLRDTPKQEIVQAIAILTWPALVAPILGPVVGGWISTHWGWEWIFLLNLPLGIAALLAALYLIRDGEIRVSPFDSLGFILSGLGFGLFMSGIEVAAHDSAGLWLALLMLVGGLVLLIWAAVHLQRTPHPMMGLEPFRIETFRVTAVGGSLFRVAINSAPFLLPLMFQLGLGFSAVESGALLMWLFAGNLCMKPATSWIMNRFGFRRVLVGNGLLVTLGFAGCAVLTTGTPYWMICGLLFLSGMARSMQYTALNTIGFADIPPDQMRDATTLFSVMQQMNAGMGVALGALALAVAEVLRDSAGATTADFQLAFWMMTGLALLAVLDSFLLPEQAGQEVLQPSS